MKIPRALQALIGVVLSLALFGSPAVLAQSIMRSPTINIPARIPSINPNVAGRAVTGIGGNSLRYRPPCRRRWD